MRQATHVRYASPSFQKLQSNVLHWGAVRHDINYAHQKSRFTAFFIECNCAVLLYDSLWHPTKHAYNLEYIHIALRCLDDMVVDVPTINAKESVNQILKAVEHAISNRPMGQIQDIGSANAFARVADQGTDGPTQRPLSAHGHIHFPSSARPVSPTSTRDYIYFNSRHNNEPSQPPPMTNSEGPAFAPSQDVSTWMDDPMSSLDFDVLTTDLFNFLPPPMDNLTTGFGSNQP